MTLGNALKITSRMPTSGQLKRALGPPGIPGARLDGIVIRTLPNGLGVMSNKCPNQILSDCRIRKGLFTSPLQTQHQTPNPTLSPEPGPLTRRRFPLGPSYPRPLSTVSPIHEQTCSIKTKEPGSYGQKVSYPQTPYA